MGAATFGGLPPGMSESDLVSLLGTPHEMRVGLGDFEAGNLADLRLHEIIDLVSQTLTKQYGDRFTATAGERTLIHDGKLCVHDTLEFGSAGAGPIIRAYDLSAHRKGKIAYLTTYEEVYPGGVPMALRFGLLNLGLRDERVRGLMTL